MKADQPILFIKQVPDNIRLLKWTRLLLASQLQPLLGHWPEEVSGVLAGSQIVALRDVSLVPGYVRKTQLVLTNEIVAYLLRLSVQPQLC